MTRRRQAISLSIALVVTLVAAAFWAQARGADTGHRSVDRSPSVADGSRVSVLDAYANLPLAFVENQGQTNTRVRYYAQGPRYGFFLTPAALVLSLVETPAPTEPTIGPAGDGEQVSWQGVSLALQFVGANPDVKIEAEAPAAGDVSYLRGDDPMQWRAGLARFGQVVYRDLWSGVDLAVRGRDGELKYEFRVEPGAAIEDIRLAYEGADGLTLDDAGDLAIETPLGLLRDSAPVAFQEVAGEQRPIDSRFVLDAGGGGELSYGFALGTGYDPDRELIIDPGLAYSTLLGGSSHEVGAAVAVDASGNAYITGITQSPSFPTTPGSFDRTGSAGNNLDAFVTKLNPTGSALIYSTFLGGSNFEWGRAIAIDSAGNAYMAGQTQSSNFPTTGGAFDRTFNVDNCPRCGIDQYDAFITKLTPSGSGLVYSTFLGGTSLDDALAIALDGARNAYVAGQTVSGNFPTTPGAFDTTANGGQDGFVTKLNPTGSALVYSTRLGGSDNELPVGVAVDAAGNAQLAGGTRSVGFPTTPGAFDTTHNGGAFDELFDGFVTKLNATGSGLVYSTFLGGAKSDFVDDFAADASGNSYLAGATLSPNFPTTPGTFDPVFDGGGQSFVTKLNSTGSAVVYSTFLDQAGASAVAPEADGSVWLAGATSSPSAFTTPDAFDPQFSGGPSDAYVAKLNPAGSALVYATFLGGTDSEGANEVALDTAGNAYVTGQTISNDFATTPGAFDRVWGGDTLIFWADAFVAKFAVGDDAPPPPPPPPPVPATPALVSPAAGAVVAPPVTFDWTDPAAAVSYTIQVDEISDFGAPLILSASVAVSEFTTAALPEGSWFWRARGVNSAGTPGPWSTVRAIQVQTAPPPPPPPIPAAPVLVSPANNATIGQPFTFDWSDVAAAAWYTIDIDDSSNFAAPLVWAATTTPSQLAINSLPNGTLFWRVRAFNAGGIGGPPSLVRTVMVQTTTPPPPPPPGPLPAPSQLSPSNDARFSPGQTIGFDWSDVSGASTYTIQIDTSQTFVAPLTVEATGPTSQFTTNTLPTVRMWWRVRANDASGTLGAWSGARRFEVKD